MSASRNQSVAKARIVASLPALGDAEIGEIYYDSTNTKLALRTVAGWIYFTKDA